MVYCFHTMFTLASWPTASRSPEFDSQAIAARSRLGAAAVGVISVNDPKEVPPQIQALASLFVASPPMSPIWSLPRLDASPITVYCTSVE